MFKKENTFKKINFLKQIKRMKRKKRHTRQKANSKKKKKARQTEMNTEKWNCIKKLKQVATINKRLRRHRHVRPLMLHALSSSAW